MEVKIPAIDNITEAAKDFLQKVITPPLEEVGLLFADQVKLWRFKNQVTILTKAENHLKAKGLKSRKVSLKVLTPMLEYGSMEEDESLQDKWAALMANTVKEGSSINTTLFSNLLSQLSKTDADVLIKVHHFSTNTMKGGDTKNGIKREYSITILQKVMFKQSDISRMCQCDQITIDNLIRLRLLKEANSSSDEPLLIFTDLGFSFVAAVHKD